MAKQLVISNLSVELKERLLYRNINISIEKGERLAFLGPNGIGKSLLLELVFLGHTNELAGRYKGLRIEGSIYDEYGNNLLDPNTKRNIAYVSQNEDFYNNMTVLDICRTSCHGIGIELNEDKLDYLLSSFHLSEKKNQKIKNNVSFGEGKIIHIISRILKLEAANIMLLDEPLNHLSFKNSKIFNDIMTEEIQNNPNLTIIMVSHCRAMNFVKKSMVYNLNKKNIEFREYRSYDCFSSEEYQDCF